MKFSLKYKRLISIKVLHYDSFFQRDNTYIIAI